MDAVCAVKIDLTPVAALVAADVEAARGDDTPGGKTITPAERDAIEQRAEAAFTAVGTELLKVPHPCSALAAGVMLRSARDTAKGLVKRLVDGPEAPRAPQSQPPPGPSERAPSAPVRPRGRILEA